MSDPWCDALGVRRIRVREDAGKPRPGNAAAGAGSDAVERRRPGHPGRARRRRTRACAPASRRPEAAAARAARAWPRPRHRSGRPRVRRESARSASRTMPNSCGSSPARCPTAASSSCSIALERLSLCGLAHRAMRSPCSSSSAAAPRSLAVAHRTALRPRRRLTCRPPGAGSSTTCARAGASIGTNRGRDRLTEAAREACLARLARAHPDSPRCRPASGRRACRATPE